MISSIYPSVKTVIALPLSKKLGFEINFNYSKCILKDILKITVSL